MRDTFTFGSVMFTLDDLSESDAYFEAVIDAHAPTDGLEFCPICCTTRTPCDAVSMAASALARSATLAAETARADALAVELAEMIEVSRRVHAMLGGDDKVTDVDVESADRRPGGPPTDPLARGTALIEAVHAVVACVRHDEGKLPRINVTDTIDAIDRLRALVGQRSAGGEA